MLEQELLQEKERYARILHQAQKSLESTPIGDLKIWAGVKGKAQYSVKGQDGKWRYLKKIEYALASKLAQRSYDKKVISDAAKSLRAIDRFMKSLGVDLSIVEQNNFADESTPIGAYNQISNIYEKMNPERRKLVRPYVLPDSEYIASWLSEQYEPMTFNDDSPKFKTDQGDTVRSKSEVIIANMLCGAGVPYYYERPLKLQNGIVVHPDFTVLNVRTRSQYYWEHFGMMDDMQYSSKQCQKLSSYMKSGIFPGDSLIFTQETSRNPLDTSLVAQVIGHYLK